MMCIYAIEVFLLFHSPGDDEDFYRKRDEEKEEKILVISDMINKIAN